MSKKYIAIIYEGNKTENVLFENIKKNFFAENVNVISIAFPAGENIYMLWKQLKRDEFVTDLIEVLREYNPIAKKRLAGMERDVFSQIYLFFDYDGQNDNLKADEDGDEILKEMLVTFSNETELGKLYINYPMVESLRDNLKENDRCYRRCMVSAKEVIHYKKIVNEIPDFQDFRKLAGDDWGIQCYNAVRKANCIVNQCCKLPQYGEFMEELSQEKIFEKQLEYFVKKKNSIAILNGVPLFILEYFKKEFWDRMFAGR